MQSLLLIATALDVGFVLLAYAARTPSQTALSSAIGVSAIIFVLFVLAVLRFRGNKSSR